MLTSTNQPWFISAMPKKTYINTTIDPELLTALKVLAAQQGKRLNQVLEEGIKLVLEKYEKATK
ncbi:ribbon-helix-helix domain-containing protein [Desulfosarcina variabilis]|uniref:ribbon-helix-helix domain-containing protein n=1 Tax=Desulfosarcina variabilis TaxID=2300 RepID=UPI003AFABF73